MNNGRSNIRVLEMAFVAILVGITWAFYRVMAPFILDIFLAVVLANVFGGVFRRFRRWFRGRRIPAALGTVLFALVTIAVPVTVIGILVYSEAVAGYTQLVGVLPSMDVPLSETAVYNWISGLPLVGNRVAELADLRVEQLIQEGLRVSSNFVITITQRSFAGVAQAVVNFIVVLLLMFFFFLDGPRLVRGIKNAAPIENAELEEMVHEGLRTTSATLISTVIIGFMEGALGTVLFLIFNVPSPFLWGVVIVILSMLPLIGTNLVITPAGIIIAVLGRPFAGILLVALGYGGVAITQNIVKPKLMGDRTGLHPALVLLATIGGIAWLGIIGFLVGPVVASLFIVIWRQFGTRYRKV
ncbi:MAG: AI-2E family transporter [Spirochaetota bacterium]